MSDVRLKKSFRDMAQEFGVLVQEFTAPTTTPAPNPAIQATQAKQQSGNLQDIEKQVQGKLDRSEKLDEIDTVTFGLETDDNKIVKVYVKAEQADDFEKELAEQLGESDNIEDVLNELSKKYEIVDVEWPDDEDDETTKPDEEDEDAESDGSEALNDKVYNKDDQMAKEDLNFGERATLTLLEGNDSGPIEQRLNTPAQLMVYNAIIELGIPEVVLNKSPYKPAIIQGIRAKGLELMRNSSLKQALKLFITRSNDYENLNHDSYARKDKKDAKADPKAKDAKPGAARPTAKQSVKESVESAKTDWKFEREGETFNISCDSFEIHLDDEQTEKLLKSVSNKDAVAVKDAEDNSSFIFSPRGVNLLVKKKGEQLTKLMTAAQLDQMFTSLGDMAAEGLTEALDPQCPVVKTFLATTVDPKAPESKEDAEFRKMHPTKCARCKMYSRRKLTA